MNVAVSFPSRDPVMLTVADFMLLRRAGAFGAYEKAELLDGELWGVAEQDDAEAESDEELPIKLTIESYELLDRAGAFDGHYKTELIDGRVYSMSPQYRPHGFAKDELVYRLRRTLESAGSALGVATEQSMAIPDFNEPQPDIMLTSQRSGEGAVPVDTVAMIVEVSDSTGRFDLNIKAAIYAGAVVPEYWVADVSRTRLHQMWKPVAGIYTKTRETPFGERIANATIKGLSIATDTLA